jgi:hypothetical protein
MERYTVAPEVLQGLQDIWDFVARDNPFCPEGDARGKRI